MTEDEKEATTSTVLIVNPTATGINRDASSEMVESKVCSALQTFFNVLIL